MNDSTLIDSVLARLADHYERNDILFVEMVTNVEEATINQRIFCDGDTHYNSDSEEEPTHEIYVHFKSGSKAAWVAHGNEELAVLNADLFKVLKGVQ